MVFGTKSNTLTLSIAGPAAKEMPLLMQGPQPETSAATLFTQGPEANSLTLHVGKVIDSSNNLELYLQASFSDPGTAPGATLFSDDTTLSISGMVETNINNSTSPFTLHMSSPSMGSGVIYAPLTVATDPIPADTTPGYFPGSGQLAVSVSGAGWTPDAGQVPLFVKIQPEQNTTAPLFMERNTPADMTLSIKNQNPIGVIPVAISGAYMSNSSMTLFTRRAPSGVLTTFVMGYESE